MDKVGGSPTVLEKAPTIQGDSAHIFLGMSASPKREMVSAMLARLSFPIPRSRFLQLIQTIDHKRPVYEPLKKTSGTGLVMRCEDQR